MASQFLVVVLALLSYSGIHCTPGKEKSLLHCLVIDTFTVYSGKYLLG